MRDDPDLGPATDLAPAIDDDDPWTALADDWAAAWGGFADPARAALLDASGVAAGTRLLDVGCGTGELLADAASRGAAVAGADVAPGMVARARRAAPAADVREADAEDLPWPGAAFDVVTAVNVLHLADDPAAAVAEAARVLAPGGVLAVCGWAERDRCELDVVEAALAADDGEEPGPEGPLRREAAVRAVLTGAGLAVERVALVDVPWSAPDADALVRGLLLGEDAAGLAGRGPVVVAAADPFRRADGSYRFRNAFRLALARRPR
ncbi:MAG: class I SAM-dependent methyltransferase [Cellulomonas sp.]